MMIKEKDILEKHIWEVVFYKNRRKSKRKW